MSVAHDPRQNHLLAALPAADLERLQSTLKLVPLRLGEVIYESGSQQNYLYFPTTAIVSLLYIMDQQLCRWLLLSLDRISGNELLMTQELIANMLGVRREGVTEAAGKLQAAGLIKYSRGHITVPNRTALEARACECYAVVKKECDRLLPDCIAY